MECALSRATPIGVLGEVGRKSGQNGKHLLTANHLNSLLSSSRKGQSDRATLATGTHLSRRPMTDARIKKSVRIHALVHATLQFLDASSDKEPVVERVLEKMRGLDLLLPSIVDVPPNDTRHTGVLADAIEDVISSDLHDIGTSLHRARHDLAWREDNADYYARDADLGDGYRNCNLHTLLIGPDACGF